MFRGMIAYESVVRHALWDEEVATVKKIMRIQVQQKQKDRYNIFLNRENGDEEFAFSVDEAVLIEYRLHKGMEVSEGLIDELTRKDTVHKAYNLAVRYLSYRMRTEKEMERYLTEKEIDPEHIGQVMARLIKESLLDDSLFAEMFVRTRINTSNKGPLLIQKELIEKGVRVPIAENAVQQYPFDEQIKKVQRFAEKKLRQRNKSFRSQMQQLKAQLMQKGFTQDAIREGLAGMEEQKDEEKEWEALVNQGTKLMGKHEKKFEGYELRQKITEGLYRKGFPFDLIQQFLDEELEE